MGFFVGGIGGIKRYVVVGREFSFNIDGGGDSWGGEVIDWCYYFSREGRV